MNFYITKPADYWIATNAVSISLNALGHKDRIQGSVASGAVIMCFVADIKPESAGGEPGNGDGLWYDANHEPKRWPLSLTPTSFKTQTRKYIYAAIPRSTSVGNTAVIVFPSQMLDVYGRIKHGEGEEETYEQIGSEDYFYVYLQGIISDSIDRGARVWEQEITNWGTLGTAQGNDEKLVEGEWYRWSTVSQTVTFLKKIIMDAGSQFMNIRLRDKELTGVATAATGAEYVDSETLVVTPSYLQDKFISKKNDDEAEGVIGFLKGIWFGIKDKWFIDDKGDATLHDINASSVQSPSVKTNNVQSSDYTGDGLADTGFRLFSEGGHSKLTVDEIYVRTKLVAEELETKKRTYSGGDQIWSCAGNQIVRVDYLGNTETADHVPVMIPVHSDGSPSSAGAADTYMVPQAGDTYGYSYIEVPWLARGLALLAGNKALSKYRKVRIVMQEPVATRGTRSAAAPISHVRRARCYFLAKDGDREIKNWWRINDLARCQTMNLENVTRKTYIADEDTKQGNIFWWRKVIGVSYEPVTLDDGKQYHYFDVAFDYDVESTSPETMATSVMEGSDIPAAGDAVVQFGNTIIEGRMNLVMIEVNGGDSVGYSPSTDAPALKAYCGVYCFDLTKCWVGGHCCKMNLAPGHEFAFYGPSFKMVTEYDVVPVPMDRGLWNDITPTRDDYREHANVRKCYYYDKVSHNGSYWLCSIVDGSHWVNASGNYISDADYAALSDEAKSQCARKQNYTIDEPSEESSDWTLVVEKGTSIRSMVTQYAKQTTAQYTGTPPTSGWEDTIADLGTINDGDYLWIKTTISYSDTLNDSTVYSVSRWGIDGDGIANIETKFYEDDDLLSQSDLAALPENSWKDYYSQLALNQGDYIYTRTKITYDQGGTPTVSYSINRLGEDGVSYVTTEEYYCLGSSNTTAPTGSPYTRNDGKPQTIPASSLVIGGDWSESRPTYDPSTAAGRAKKYLWNFEVSYDTTTNVQVTQPLCIANYEKGIQSIVETYTVSTHPTKADMLADTAERTAHPWVDEVQNSAPTDAFPYQWNKTVTTYTDNSTDTFYHISAVKGTRGSNGDTPISVFAWNQSPDTAPAISGNAYPPIGWNVTAPSRPSTAGDHYLWMSQSVKHANDTIDNWGTPVRISGDNGDAGEDASDQEFVYIRLNTYPFPNNVTKPADATRGKVHGTGDWIPAADQYETDDWVPEGWSDTALPATENEKYVYAAIRKKSAGHNEDWDDFGEPFLWSNWGVQGIDGDGVQYVYKLFDHELTAAERESNIPTKPQSQTHGEWIPTGWSDDPLAPTVNMQYCYCSTIKKIGGSWADTFDTLGLWSRYSKDGTNGDTPMQAFQWNQSATVAPSPLPSGGTLGSWSATAPNRPSGDGEYFLWMTQTVKHISVNGTVTYDNWSVAVRISGNNGTNGEDGTDYEYIYILKTTQYTFPTNEKPANISTGEVSPGGHAASGSETDKQLDDWVPNGWWDNPQGIDSTNKFEYMSLRVKPKGSDTWGAFSDPFIWSHWGRNGMDGDGTEYVFIRTKNNVPPVMDSTQSGSTADEFRPTITPASQAASDTEQAQTTDDPRGTDETYKYEWVAKRKMNAPDASGQRTWKKFTGENNDYKMSLWSNYAESALVIDIDNDADQFGTDSLGVVTPAPQVKTTEVSLSYGVTAQVLNADDAQTPGVVASLFYEDDTAVPSTVAEVSCHRDTTDTTKGEVEVTIKSGTFPSAHSGIYAQITATCARGSKSISFTIQQVKSGAPGVAPDLCNLRPTTNSINFTKSEQQGSTRKTLGCGYTLVTPSGTTNVATAESVVVNGTTYYIYWRYVGGTYAKFTTSAAIYNPGILPTTSESGVEFCLSSATSASGITDANTLDYEKVPILKDGKDGNDSMTIALTNENEDFLYNEAGTLIAPVGGATSQASLKEGTTDRTTSATWAVSCDGGTTWAEQGAYTSGNAKAKITPSGGLLSVEELYQDSVVIKVRAFYGYKYYYKDFTANKVFQDKYDIHVSPSSIAFNDSETWVNKQITASASGVDLQGNPIAVTISSDTTPVAGRFYVFYGYVNSDGSIGSLMNTEGSYVTLSRTMARSKMGVYFELRKYITASTYRLCDYETVEIAKTENGADGWMFTANPANVILTQDMNTLSQFTSAMVSFSAKKGNVDVAISSIGTPTSSEFNVAKGTGDNIKKVVVSSPKTHGTPAEYYTEGSFVVTVNATDPDSGSTVSFDVTVLCYANLYGTFKTEVVGDTETSIATKLTYGYDPNAQQVLPISTFGTYIRSSEVNISTLEKNVAGVNLLATSGFTNDAGEVVRDSYFDEERGRLAAALWSPLMFLEAGTYTLSYYMTGTPSTPHNASAKIFTGKPSTPNSTATHNDVLISMTEVSGDTYMTYKRYKGSLVLAYNRYVYISLPASSNQSIYRWQLEKVGDYPTPTKWVEGAKYYKSEIKQTAEEIDATVRDDLGEVGIHISGSDKSIQAIGEKFSWENNNGDQLLGMDSDGNATFAGTVRAKNFFHRLCVAEGSNNNPTTEYYNSVSLYITNATQFKSDAEELDFLSEVSNVQNGDVLVWDAEHYPTGVQYGQVFDGARACTGDADEVIFIDVTTTNYGTLYLPPAASCLGKKVTVHNKHHSGYGITVYSADTTNEQMGGSCTINSNKEPVLDSAHPGQGISVDPNCSCSFLAINGGWLMLEYTPART